MQLILKPWCKVYVINLTNEMMKYNFTVIIEYN
jgi:hypothetical protein